MKYLFINAVCGTGSTGRICTDLAAQLEKEGHEVKIAYGRHGFVPEFAEEYAVRIGSDLDVKLHAVGTRLTDRHGFFSKGATKKFLRWAEVYDPDVLWLHNIHGYYINIELLFDWIKSRPQMQVKWTLHDCWAFTGHCAYFDMVGCEKWKDYCAACPQKDSYPGSLLVDNSKKNFERKKAAFTGVSNMTLITPSGWLANLVKQSFLKEYSIEVRYNTTDREIFKPTDSDFRKAKGLTEKKILLGVASTWEPRKGLNTLCRLAQELDERYAVVLVGLSPEQIEKLPPEVLGLPRTNSPKELAEIYTAADVLVNPSLEETFGMTVVEAQACGTPAIVYKNTACEEIVNMYGEGVAVEPGWEHIKEALSALGI